MLTNISKAQNNSDIIDISGYTSGYIEELKDKNATFILSFSQYDVGIANQDCIDDACVIYQNGESFYFSYVCVYKRNREFKVYFFNDIEIYERPFAIQYYDENKNKILRVIKNEKLIEQDTLFDGNRQLYSVSTKLTEQKLYVYD